MGGEIERECVSVFVYVMENLRTRRLHGMDGPGTNTYYRWMCRVSKQCYSARFVGPFVKGIPLHYRRANEIWCQPD